MAELHLPDLPEVPLQVGGVRARPRAPLGTRIRDGLSSYLPLLAMVLLALGSWWLVKNVPPVSRSAPEAAPRSDPDYTMSNFVLERFEASGRVKARLHGAQLRHYPDTDRVEVDQLQLVAWSPDGQVTRASAQRALSNGDASEVQLSGQAVIEIIDAQGQVTTLRSEFLHLFAVDEVVRTHLPVRVLRQDGSEFRAAALTYEHGRGRLQVQGPLRASLPARGGGR